MRLKKFLGLVLACAVLTGCFSVNVLAAEGSTDGMDPAVEIQRATGRFSMSVSPGKIKKADSSFPLEAGEVVTINAVYSPDVASVDFGLIDSDNIFHFMNVTNGNIDQGIEIKERGNYTFAVRNNSSYTVEVTGFVNY